MCVNKRTVFCASVFELGLGPGTQLFVKVPWPEDSEWPFQSSSQAASCYYQSNHLKVEAIPLSAFPKDTTSELAGLSPH